VERPNLLSIAMNRMSDGRLVLRLGGQFDADAAARLRDRIQACAPGERIVVDFSRLERVYDLALGMLGSWRDVLAPAREVSLVGLASHASRILRAFALEAA
jgi:anti-anti-sigma regulatory factor